MGASSHASIAFVDRLVRHGRRAVKLDASDLMSLAPGFDVADSYVFVSEGGRSRETIAAAQLAPTGRRLGLTNDPSAPFSQVVDAVISLGHGEDSPVYTIGYSSTLQAFGLLATAIDGLDDGDDWRALPGRVSDTLDSLGEKAKLIAARLEGLTSLDFVGSGTSLASTAEAALIFREATQTCTATYATYQYLHGPMEPLTSQQGCVLFGDRSRGFSGRVPREQRHPGRARHLRRGGRGRRAFPVADTRCRPDLALDPRDPRRPACRR